MLKLDNEKERADIKRDRRIADSMKFNVMKKKASFLPALHSKPFLQDTNSINIGTDFIDARDLKKLWMPEKCLTSPKGKNWKL